MANSQQRNTDLKPSKSPAAAREEHEGEEIPITRRLRDREMLRKRKEEAQEKDSTYWIYREVRTKKLRKSRRAKQGLHKQLILAPKQASELKAEKEAKSAEELVEKLEDVQAKPKPQEKPEPVAPEPVAPEPAPPEPVQQEQLPVLTTQGLGTGMPMVAVDGELATCSQDAVGELLESRWLSGDSEAVQSHLSRTISQGDEELLRLAEAETPDDLDTPLDNLCQDNEYMPFLV